MSDEVTPGPIPNPAVKLVSADGSMWATACKSRSLPEDSFLFSYSVTSVMDKELRFDYACGNQTKAIERSSDMSLDELFCDIDDFCQEFLPKYYVELKANKL